MRTSCLPLLAGSAESTLVPGGGAKEARLRLYGIGLDVEEGIEWQVAPTGDARSTLSAHVWAEFPEA